MTCPRITSGGTGRSIKTSTVRSTSSRYLRRMLDVAHAFGAIILGPVSSVCIMGQPIIVLNSLKACEDLLEKRSAIYSGRPVLQFAGEM